MSDPPALYEGMARKLRMDEEDGLHHVIGAGGFYFAGVSAEGGVAVRHRGRRLSTSLR